MQPLEILDEEEEEEEEPSAAEAAEAEDEEEAAEAQSCLFAKISTTAENAMACGAVITRARAPMAKEPSAWESPTNTRL